ncbi:MAG: sulfotransferase family protein [Xanthobacteraceae bacterium]
MQFIPRVGPDEQAMKHFCRTCLWYLRRARAYVANRRDCWVTPSAAAFFNSVCENHFDPETYIDVLPQYSLIYLCVPKAASSTIRSVLSSLEVGTPPGPPLALLYNRRCTGLRSPRLAGYSVFHQLAKSPEALRFTFVRNPYARLLSAWTNRFQGKPLIDGEPSITAYRAYRSAISRSLPDGVDQTLSFPQFVEFATATAEQRIDIHWQQQHDFVLAPGLDLNLIGKVETFKTDFALVLNHIGLSSDVRDKYSNLQVNESMNGSWRSYYSNGLADRVYRAYERDFDIFGYPRGLESIRSERRVAC